MSDERKDKLNEIMVSISQSKRDNTIMVAPQVLKVFDVLDKFEGRNWRRIKREIRKIKS